MKETFSPPNMQIDPAFNKAEATAWHPPIAGEHTNFLSVGEHEVQQPSDQIDQIIEIQKKYMALESKPGWSEMSEVSSANLSYLQDASLGAFHDRKHRSSTLILSNEELIVERKKNRGDGKKDISDGHYFDDYSTAYGDPLPEQSSMLVGDLYTLTGAKVIRDDREKPNQQDYTRYLLGNFNGRQLLFVEHSFVPDYKGSAGRQFTLAVTDNMEQLKQLSLDETKEFFPHMGNRAHVATKDELADIRDMIDNGQSEIERLTSDKST